MMNTKIDFLKVPYTVDGAHQYLPNANQPRNAATQAQFFRSNFYLHQITNRVLVDPNDTAVLVRGDYGKISQANYIMFRNPSYGNKIFYAYIIDLVPRAGNETVEVHYVIDSVQTYLFEWYNNVKEGQVFREHINHANPKWIDPTLSEDVPTGKLETTRIIQEIQNKTKYGDDNNKKGIRWAVFISSKSRTQLGTGTPYGDFKDEPSVALSQNLYYYAIPIPVGVPSNGSKITLNGSEPATLNELSNFFATDEKAVNSLVKVIIKNDLPIKDLKVSGTVNKSITIGDGIGNRSLGGYPVIDLNSINRELDIDGTVMAQANNIFDTIHPDNYRLRYPPFTRYYIETEDGIEKEFDVSKLPGNEVVLRYRTNLGPIDDSILHIDRYNSRHGYFNEELQYELYTPFANSKSVPVISNQLASLVQSQDNQMQASKKAGTAGMVMSALQTTAKVGVAATSGLGTVATMSAVPAAGASTIAVSSAGVAGVAGTAATFSAGAAAVAAAPVVVAGALALGAAKKSYDDTVRNIEARLNDAKNIPDSVGNIGADLTYNILNRRISNAVKVKTVSASYEALAKDYFNRNGYKILRVKLPALTTRIGYNYIQCDLNIGGASIPQKHINDIKEKFLTGITFWHNSSVYNYSQNNGSIPSSYHG